MSDEIALRTDEVRLPTPAQRADDMLSAALLAVDRELGFSERATEPHAMLVVAHMHAQLAVYAIRALDLFLARSK